MFVVLIISGVIMGLIAAVPIGPVNLICIRRSFAFGPVNGFVSGLGAALGDGVFAAITFFGLTWIAELIQSYDVIIELVGGALLVWFGVHTILSPAAGKVEDGDKNEPGASTLVRAMVSTFVLTITNPATLIAFASMFASFRALVGGANSYVDAGFVVAGVVGGSAGWWLCLTSVIGIFHTRITDRTVRIINRGSGVLVALFGLAVLIHVVMKVFALNG
ncbi:MAG: LysE family transporter [Proteobacteria bacterium]|nr:LysE family transporter [Pseudomonadota bacterium]